MNHLKNTSTAQHLAGAHLAELAGKPRHTQLRALLGPEVGELVATWHRRTLTHGRDYFRYPPGSKCTEYNPAIEDLLAVPTVAIPTVAEKLAELGVVVPTREACRQWAKADMESGGDGIDPQLELDRAVWGIDPDLSTTEPAEERICGVPKSIYELLTDGEKVKVQKGTVIAPPQAPTFVARWLVRNMFTARCRLPASRHRAWMRTLCRIDRTWYVYTDGRWAARTDPEWMRGQLRELLGGMWFVKDQVSRPGGVETHTYSLKAWNPDTRTLTMVEDALADLLNVGSGTAAHELPDAYGVRHGAYTGTLALCRNGVLDVDTGTLVDNTPLWFSLTRIEADYDHSLDPYADTEWVRMLRTQWPNDPDAITCLQMWFGYVLSGRTDLQKWMLILGPSGSGKSIIASVLAALLGTVTATKLDTLNSQWGLQSLYETGASLALMSDIRFGVRDSNAAVGNMLAVVGEDAVTVERKYKTAVEAVLGTRFHASANEMPRWSDNTNALALRALLLETSRSFRGTDDEDHGLRDRIIAAELGQVLRWAVEGLALLDAAGGMFTRSSRSEELHADLADLSSSVRTFVGRCCELGTGEDFVDLQALYRVWSRWAAENNTGRGMSQNKFRSALKSLYVGDVRPGQKQMPDGRPGAWLVVYGITRAECSYTERGQYGLESRRTASTDPRASSDHPYERN